MNMMKIFRRHGRAMLMVFMALLLVAFLIPNTIQGCGERDRLRTLRLGEAYGRTISNETRAGARAEMEMLGNMGFPPLLSLDSALEYYLLTEEARYLGLRIGREEVTNWLRQVGFSDAVAQRLQTRYRRSWNEICAMIGRWMAVNRLVQMQAGAVFETLPREALAFRDQNQQAVAQLSVLESRAFLHLVPEPTEEELLAFFEECKGRTTAHTEEELVFGYRYPDRVRIEYLTVDPEKVRQKVQVKNSQVRQYFEDNAQLYTKPDPSASQPAGGQPPQIPMSFEEARELAREDLRRVRAIEEAQELVNDLYHELNRPWAAMEKDADGFTLPPAGDPPSLEELRSRFSMKYEVEYYRSELVDAQQLQLLPGFGGAGLGEGQQRISAPTLAFRVKGIVTRTPDDRAPVLNVYEPAPVVTNRQPDLRTRESRPYQAYLFRVVEVRPSEPPASLDEVRDRVVQDWKLAKAHELARTHAQALADRAREMGLPAAVEAATELKEILTAAEQASTQPAEARTPTANYLASLTPFTPARLTRSSTFLERLGSVEKLPRALFALAEGATTDTAPAHRVTVLPMASRFRWVVGELVEVKPLYEEEFQRHLAQLAQRRQSEELRKFVTEWRQPEKVQQRTGFISAPRASGPPGPAQ
jgi:hypothetical protein